MPSLPVSAYLSSIYSPYSNDDGLVSLIVHSKCFSMMLFCFFASWCDGHLTHTYGFAEIDNYQGSLIVSLTTVTSAGQDGVGQYNINRKYVFNLVRSILSWPQVLEIDWDKYVCVGHYFLR